MNKIKNYLISLGIGYIMIFILFLITSVIFAYTNIKDSNLNIAIYICLGISALVSSFLLGKKVKEKGVIIGIIYGIIFYGLVYIIGIIINGVNFSIDTLIYFLISIVTSIVGAIFGVNL